MICGVRGGFSLYKCVVYDELYTIKCSILCISNLRNCGVIILAPVFLKTCFHQEGISFEANA
jgi:hypothetical protein